MVGKGRGVGKGLALGSLVDDMVAVEHGNKACSEGQREPFYGLHQDFPQPVLLLVSSPASASALFSAV